MIQIRFVFCQGNNCRDSMNHIFIDSTWIFCWNDFGEYGLKMSTCTFVTYYAIMQQAFYAIFPVFICLVSPLLVISISCWTYMGQIKCILWYFIVILKEKTIWMNMKMELFCSCLSSNKSWAGFILILSR